MSLTQEQYDDVHTLWDALADFPASQADEALRFLMESVARWLGADDLVWIGAARIAQGAAARRDVLRGWRGLRIRHLRLNEPIASRSRQAAAAQETPDPGMTTQALVAGIGRMRIHSLHDGFVDLAAFRRTSHYRMFYQEAGITDRLFVGCPINADTESFLLVDRYSRSERFSGHDMELLGYALRPLKWFQRELMLSHGLLLANAPLTPTDRRIVRLLLTERSEKEIAAELGQAPKTTHKYITEIFRKFGVSGRIGLMALWLGRQG